MILILASVVLLGITAGAFFTLDRQNARHALQVADLCQRVQAPDTAVATHAVTQFSQQPAHLPWGDDEAYLKYANEVNGARTE